MYGQKLVAGFRSPIRRCRSNTIADHWTHAVIDGPLHTGGELLIISELQMKLKFEKLNLATVPKRRKRASYDESLDGSGSLIVDEPADVEEETPAAENKPIEEIEHNDVAKPRWLLKNRRQGT